MVVVRHGKFVVVRDVVAAGVLWHSFLSGGKCAFCTHMCVHGRSGDGQAGCVVCVKTVTHTHTFNVHALLPQPMSPNTTLPICLCLHTFSYLHTHVMACLLPSLCDSCHHSCLSMHHMLYMFCPLNHMSHAPGMLSHSYMLSCFLYSLTLSDIYLQK